jgi:hypothetical protein
MKKLPKNISGQALLLVLLSMSVVLTIVLSILARSTVDIGISSRSEESVRAFSAAEAGIEQALVAGSTGLTPIGDATFNATVSSFSSGVTQFVLPSSLYSGESAIVWFVSHDTNGNLSCSGPGNPCFRGSQIQVCWGKEGTSASADLTPAVEVSIIYLSDRVNYTTARIARETVDPNDTRRSLNSFSDYDGVDCQVGGQNFAFKKTIVFSGLSIPSAVYSNTNGLQLARISLLYNTDIGHPVSVIVPSSSLLPAQGIVIDSSGVSGASTRKVEVIRGFKELPGIFEPVVFAGGGITN